MKIKSVIDKYPNFDVWPTGGGCEAYGHPLDNGGHILITAVDDPSLPEPDDKFVSIGAYDANAEPGKFIRRCAVTNLERSIDRMIAAGAIGRRNK